MHDANRTYSTAINYMLTNRGSDKYSMPITADAEWFKEKERAFPVVIYPTTVYYHKQVTPSGEIISPCSRKENH